MSEKLKVVKLASSESYSQWAMDLRAVLKHHRCWTWVKGTNETPLPKQIKAKGSGPANPDVDNPAYTTWEEGTNDVFYHILLTCEPKVQDQIADICIPAVAWKRLKDLYKPSNLSTQFNHLSMIWNISLDDLSWDALWVDLVHSDDHYRLLIPPLF